MTQLKQLIEVVNLLGGVIGILGGSVGIWSALRSNRMNQESEKISRRSLENSEKSLVVSKDALILRHNTFVYWNAEKNFSVNVTKLHDSTADLFDDSEYKFNGYTTTMTINPFIFSGVAKAIFVCGNCLENEVSITNNRYNTIEVNFDKNLSFQKLFVIYLGSDNTFSFECFLLFPENIDTGTYWKYDERIDSKRLNLPKNMDILKFTEDELVAIGTFKNKKESFFNSHSKIKQIEISSDEIQEEVWMSIDELKLKYRIFEL